MNRRCMLMVLLAGLTMTGSVLAGVIEGFVGYSSTQVAQGVTVKLMDGESGRVVDIDETGFFGKYKFTDVAPGYYRIQVNDVVREVMLTGDKKRLDIDLSAEGGAMDYGKAGREELSRELSGGGAGGAGGGAAAAPPGPNDETLAGQIAGVWWGYAGSTERRIGLCPGGLFKSYTESSYSGSGYDSLGNQNLAWGSASQGGGQGRWTIQGDTQSGVISVRYNNGATDQLRYRQIGKPGCLDINGATLCRESAQCQ